MAIGFSEASLEVPSINPLTSSDTSVDLKTKSFPINFKSAVINLPTIHPVYDVELPEAALVSDENGLLQRGAIIDTERDLTFFIVDIDPRQVEQIKLCIFENAEATCPIASFPMQAGPESLGTPVYYIAIKGQHPGLHYAYLTKQDDAYPQDTSYWATEPYSLAGVNPDWKSPAEINKHNPSLTPTRDDLIPGKSIVTRPTGQIKAELDQAYPIPKRKPVAFEIDRIKEIDIKVLPILAEVSDEARKKHGTFEFLADPEVAAIYKRDMRSRGITSVQFMPITASLTEFFHAKKGEENVWGYNPISPFLLNQDIIPGETLEDQLRLFRKVIYNLTTDYDDTGTLQVGVDYVGFHSAEGLNYATGDDEIRNGPDLACEILAEASYFHATSKESGAPRHHFTSTGCGNTYDIQSPLTRNLHGQARRFFRDILGVDFLREDQGSGFGQKLTNDGLTADEAFLRGLKPDTCDHSVTSKYFVFDPDLAYKLSKSQGWDIIEANDGVGFYAWLYPRTNRTLGFIKQVTSRFLGGYRTAYDSDGPHENGEISTNVAYRLLERMLGNYHWYSRDYEKERSPKPKLNMALHVLENHDGLTLSDAAVEGLLYLLDKNLIPDIARLVGTRDLDPDTYTFKDPILRKTHLSLALATVAIAEFASGPITYHAGTPYLRTQFGGNDPYFVNPNNPRKREIIDVANLRPEQAAFHHYMVRLRELSLALKVFNTQKVQQLGSDVNVYSSSGDRIYTDGNIDNYREIDRFVGIFFNSHNMAPDVLSTFVVCNGVAGQYTLPQDIDHYKYKLKEVFNSAAILEGRDPFETRDFKQGEKVTLKNPIPVVAAYQLAWAA